MTEGVEVGIVLEPRGDVRTLVERARLAEELGFEFVGITDGQMIWSDAVVALTATALATKRIRMGPWVTNPVTRHVTVIANYICTLDAISDGRAFLGIGNGDDAVRTIGAPPATMDSLAEVVDTLRTLIDGDEVKRDPVSWRISTARGRGLKIYWAGANPKSLTYGARHTDGLVVSGFVDDEWLEAMLTHIREGAGGEPREVFFNSSVAVAEDGAAARDAVRPYVASGLRYASAARLRGWSKEDVDRMQRAYDSYHHFRDTNLAAVALVPDEMIPRKSISGTPEQAAKLMEIVISHGIHKFALMPMGDVETTMRLLAKRVRPLLGAGRGTTPAAGKEV
jgi:alkanesulfonate monooxygenase SsuD/methylene tetrahydromethanopterin reductase-like flavin-dependent oxidoreductase (luciferase family)